MSFNGVENPMLTDAIAALREQYERMGGTRNFGLGFPEFMLVDGGRLTVVERVKYSRGKKIPVPDSRYTPVDCYNGVPNGIDLHHAILWYQGRRQY